MKGTIPFAQMTRRLDIKEAVINTVQKMKFSIKDSFSKCDQIRRETADLVTLTEEILNGKLHFLCNVISLCIKT